MKEISAWLKERRQSGSGQRPSLHWKSFLFVAINLVILAMLVFDGPIAAAAATQISPIVRQIGNILTDFGKSGWILFATAILFFQGWAAARVIRKPKRRFQALATAHIAAYAFISVAVSGLAANLLKRIIGRARPINFDDWGQFGFSPLAFNSRFESFPSGHSTTFGAFFMVLALLMPRYRLPFAILAIWFAMTRVIVGAHYPSDVIAGLAFGAWFSLATAIVFSRYRILFRLSDTGFPVLRYRLPGTGQKRLPPSRDD